MLLTGSETSDTLTGGADGDTLYGLGGNDRLSGGAGDDVLAGNEGADTLLGGEGDDYLLGGPGNDTLDGGAGNDWAAYEDAASGVTVNLTLTGNQNTRGGGTDRLISIENLYGSAFNDTLTGDAKANMIGGGEGADTLAGGLGDDTLNGGAGNDNLRGGDGDDYIFGGPGDDTIDGGAGADWTAYEDATSGVTVNLTLTTAQNTGGGGSDLLIAIENVYGSAFDDVLTGDAKNNYLYGGDGDDKIYGGAGDDHLSGGTGDNLLDGGDGFDTVDYGFSEVGIRAALIDSTLPPAGQTWQGDLLFSIEAVMGSAHDDIIQGNYVENYLFGDAGNDLLAAVGGYDTLDGGDGDDTLIGSNLGVGDLMLGGAGNDLVILPAGLYGEVAATIDGGVGVDTLQFNTTLNVTFDLRILGNQQVAIATQAVVQNIENITGGDGDDRLIGDSGDNVLMGRAGNDVIWGGGGGDIVDGGEGVDTLRFVLPNGVGLDFPSGITIDLSKSGIQYAAAGMSLTLSSIEDVWGSNSTDNIIGNDGDNKLDGLDGNDSITGGLGNDTLSGGNGSDALSGGAGQDILFGGEGNDTLSGGAGRDIMVGGEGADIFMFDRADRAVLESRADIITDFQAGDRLFFEGGPSGSAPGAFVRSEGISNLEPGSAALALLFQALTNQSFSGVTLNTYTVFQAMNNTYMYVSMDQGLSDKLIVFQNTSSSLITSESIFGW